MNTCPNCHQPVSGDVSTCPQCGHDLGVITVDGSVEGPTRRPRPGWIALAGVLVAVIAVGLGAWAFVGRTGGSAASYAARIPGDVVAFVEVDVSQMTSDQAKSVAEAFGPSIEAATGKPFDLQTAVDDMMSQLESRLGDVKLSFEEDIAPWASGQAALGLLSADSTGGRGVAIIGGRDPQALDAFLTKLESAPGVSKGDVVTTGGVDFTTLTHNDSTFLVARQGTDLLVASDSDAASSLVSVGSGSSLADVSDVSNQLALLPAHPALVYAADGSALKDLSSLPGGMGAITGDVTAGWTTGAVSVTDQGLRFDATTADDAANPVTFDDRVIDAMPADTVAFLRFGSLADRLEAMANSAGGSMLQGMESDLGISLKDVFSLFSVDGGLAVWPSTDPELPVNGALVGVSDSDTAALVDKLAALAPMAGLDGQQTDGGYTLGGVATLGSRGPVTLLTTDPDLVPAPPAQSFADGDLYRRATGLVKGDLSLAIDVPAVIDLVDGLVASDNPTAADALRCLPLGVLAAGTNTEGGIVHTTGVLEISPRC
jgi:hypothetical protein